MQNFPVLRIPGLRREPDEDISEIEDSVHRNYPECCAEITVPVGSPGRP